MKPIILKEDKDGNIKIVPEEIQKMIDDAYQAGFEDGRRSVPITIQPTLIEPWWRSPWHSTDHVSITTCKAETPQITL